MSDEIEILPATGTWVVRAGGAVIAETTRALELREAGHEPVIYFPREGIGMEFLDRSDTRTHCPKKGDASYFTFVAKSGPVTDCAWSYEDPLPRVAAIRGHLAFRHERVAVERL